MGAVLSGVAFLDFLPRSTLPPDVWQPLLAVLLALCVLTALAGWALYQRRVEGQRLSLFVWLLQLPSFAIGSFRYGLTLGPYAYVGLLPNGLAGVVAGFAPHAAIRWRAAPPSFATGGINLVAVIALVVLWRTTRPRVAASLAPAA